MALNTYLLIISLNVNRLNASMKRYSVVKRTRKQDPYICCVKETHLRMKNT